MPEGALTRFAERELGLDLYDGQRDILDEFSTGGYRELVLRCGRRSGKSLISDIVALYDATVRDLADRVRPGETRTAAIVCPRLEQAVDHIASVKSLIEGAPRLAALVESSTTDSVTFKNRARIRALPASARGVRGGAFSSLVLDEAAFFLATETNASGEQILAATAPSLAQFGRDGWQLTLSTPLWQSGIFWRLDQRARSGRFPHVLHAHRPTWEMNPTIEPWWFEEKRLEDPDLYQREFGAEFLDGAASFLSMSDINAAVRAGQKATPPREGVTYKATIDPAYVTDNFAMAVGHVHDGVTYVDLVTVWAKQGHAATLDGVADLCRAYRISNVLTDQGAGVQPILEGLTQRGLRVRYQPWTAELKMQAYGQVKVALNTGTLSLPDDRDLVEELGWLESRPTPSGGVRIAGAGGHHDDRASAVAALVEDLAGRHQARPEDVHRAIGLMESLRQPESSLSGLSGLLGDVGGQLGGLWR